PRKGIWVEEPASFEKLHRNSFGTNKKGKLFLEVEEALYALNFLRGTCFSGKSDELTFNKLAAIYSKENPRLFIKYNAFRDWRDRGLILKRIEYLDKGNVRKKPKISRKYPARKIRKVRLKAEAVWYSKSFYSVIEDEAEGRMLFDEYWIGQWGIYKQDRRCLLKLEFMETVFLAKHFGLRVSDLETRKKLTHSQILRQVIKEREYAKQLYDVYEDWRLKAFVIKTGFKFGTHFRIYFPGASPRNESKEWIHSKHVIHVFPKDQKMLISEWARAVRVAHGVKKTFLLSIPEMKKEDYVDYPAEFIAWRRKKHGSDWVRETPEDKPRYLLAAVAEDEHIGGVELASLLRKAESLGLELILSIGDRETAITYYVLKKVILPGSDYEYYEIEWMKP
ncbi:MAG: tRNA-intron lyase, partial [Candidatus Aenigmarchaeota archaeon]|nr:tRNA-intron lyase [Candidatus Aenigmarchaeota archaeon]